MPEQINTNQANAQINAIPVSNPPKDKAVAVLLAFFLGPLGVHDFYLGKIGQGVTKLVIFLVSWPLMFLAIGLFTIWIPVIWAFIDFIILLTKPNSYYLAIANRIA